MTALGIYAQPPTPEELEQQARAVGGEHVLAAALANALYGAAVGTGMVTEGNMLAAGAGAQEMSIAREQMLKASGADDGPGVIGVMHWQAGHVWNFLKTMDGPQSGPLGTAAALASGALLTLLACMSVTDTTDARAATVLPDLERVRADLVAAVEALDSLPATAAAMFAGGEPGA